MTDEGATSSPSITAREQDAERRDLALQMAYQEMDMESREEEMKARKPRVRSAREARQSRSQRLNAFDFTIFAAAERELLEAFVAASAHATTNTITYSGFTCTVFPSPGVPYMDYERLPAALFPQGATINSVKSVDGKYRVVVRIDIFVLLTGTPLAEWNKTKVLRVPPSPYFT